MWRRGVGGYAAYFAVKPLIISRGGGIGILMKTGNAVLCLAALVSAAGAATSLETTVIDVEGGKAVLTVSPSGESLLFDLGWPGYGGRDTGRIVEAAKAAGLKQNYYPVVSHYDLDHLGDVPAGAIRGGCHPGGECKHGAGAARGFHRTRSRSAKFCAGCFRRGRWPARLRSRAGTGHSAGHRSGHAGGAFRLRRSEEHTSE